MSALPHRITQSTTNDGTILWLRFETEHRQNVMTLALIRELREVIRGLETAPGKVRVMVLRGAPRVFCAGMHKGELSTLDAAGHRAVLVEEHDLWRAIENLPLVTIASLAGPVVGFGAHFALCCDVRVAAEDVRIGLPEIRLAVAATAQRIARFVGIGRAKEILLSGRLFPADVALSWGLLTEVVQREHLEERTRTTAEFYAGLSRSALALAKASVENAFKWESSQHAREIDTVHGSIMAPDFREAMDAGEQRRPPKFA
ncbi:MAG: enoyl-CoA hydratase/isomerase family protein [Lautropia sp.]